MPAGRSPSFKSHFCFIFLSIILLQPLVAHALPFRIAAVVAPAGVRFSVNGLPVRSLFKEEKTILYLPPETVFPFVLQAAGPMGGRMEYPIGTPADLKQVRIEERLIRDKNPNPRILDELPLLCPRVRLVPGKKGDGPFSAGTRAIYDASKDKLNRVPVAQLLDRDAKSADQYKAYTEMDGKNALLLRAVRLSYDYEDNNIIDYAGPHPLTEEPQVIHEGEGGFYANLHYAVIPYSNAVETYDRQLLLHMAQGSLSDIDQEEHRPKLRTHSFIPGPFLSKPSHAYDLCEWGDTAHQAPIQEMEYENLALWDWDYSIRKADPVLLIVWEGDEEDWMIREKMLHPFTLTDDLVGVFKIRRKDTVKPLTLKNTSGDFEITVQTGDIK